jgi:S-adenosylmethionine:diacylglycerol 3-amino-3-carboxypropyl transferase
MYEDAELDRGALAGKRRIFCIASAGDTAICLAKVHEVVACDINPVQLAYAESRLVGAPRTIGDAERMMRFARAFFPLVGWWPSLVRRFLALSDPAEQSAFWARHLNTFRFRLGFDFLFCRPVLRAVYSPDLLSLLPRRFGAVLRGRMECCFRHHANASNPYARALLLGEFCDRSHEQDTRDRYPLQFVQGDAASYLESCPERSFDGFTLSNILDGATLSYRIRLTRAVRRAATEDAIVILRSFAEPPADLKENHAAEDRAMLWGTVEIRPASLEASL